MKGIIFALVLLLSVSAFAQYEYTDEHKQAADDINRVMIECSSGRIYCEQSNNNEARVLIKKMIYLDDEEDAKELAEACKVEFNVRRQALEVTVDMPRRSSLKRGFFKKLLHGDLSRELEILIKVMLPKGINLDVKCSSADVFANDLDNNNIQVNGSSSDVSLEEVVGDIYIDVSSGDLEAYHIKGNIELDGSSSDYEIEDISGNVRASTSSGDGVIDKVIGDVDIKTSSGEVRAYGVDGNFTVRTSSGDVVAESITGSANASTSSGTVQFRKLTNTDGMFSAYTNSGDVYIELADKFGGRVELETVSGDISAEFDQLNVRNRGRKFLTGTVGSGDGNVDIETSSGDITLGSY